MTGEKLAFAIIHFGGLLALLVGVVFQFTIGGKSLQGGLLAYLITRVLTSFWQAARPDHVLVRKPSRFFAVMTGLILLALAYAVSLPFWAYP